MDPGGARPEAVRIAAASDKQRRRGGVRSPLEGIPVLLKDNTQVRRPPTFLPTLPS
jgi:amidase